MREIKFRAWTKEEMIYEGWNENFFVNKEIIFRYDDVMQYTGLKDKNGKEIYEGDVVKVYDQEVRIVEFKNAFWQLEDYVGENKLGGFGTPMDSGHKPMYRYPENNIEVIGNIYEHPELNKEAELSQQ